MFFEVFAMIFANVVTLRKAQKTRKKRKQVGGGYMPLKASVIADFRNRKPWCATGNYRAFFER